MNQSGGLITRILPCLLLGITQVRTIRILKGIDELLRNRAIVVTILNIGSSLRIESLGTLHEQVGTAQLFPAVPLTQQLACALVETTAIYSLLISILILFVIGK